MTSAPQYVTLVIQGGTPVRLGDQKGAPYPTTGRGGLVFSSNPVITGATLNDSTFNNLTSIFDTIQAGPGTRNTPAIQLTDTSSKTPGLFSTGPGNITLVGTDGTEVTRTLLAEFDHPGDLTIPYFIYASGEIPPTESSSMVATTQWVRDYGAAVAVGDTPPLDPKNGNQWWDSTLGKMFVWYVDIDGGQWVPATPSVGGGGGLIPGSEVTTPWLNLVSSTPTGLSWTATSAAVDSQSWRMATSTAGSLVIDALSNAWVSQHRWILGRDGSTTFPGNLTVDGTITSDSGGGGGGGGDDLQTTPVAARTSTVEQPMPDWLAGGPIISLSADIVVLAGDHVGAWLHVTNDIGVSIYLSDDWLPGWSVGVRQVGEGMGVREPTGNSVM